MFHTFFLPFISYKYLLFQLVQRDIKARYKQSFIGYAWVILNPLSQLMVYTFVFSLIFRFPTEVPYVFFLYAALLPWTTFATSLQSSTQSLVDNAALLKKVAFPREVIVYASVLAKSVDFFFSAGVFFLLALALQTPLAATFWLFPLLFIVQIFLTIGLGFFLATCNLFYRDTQYLVNLLIMLWMYLTPILYPLELVPEKYTWIYFFNPLVGIVEGYRAILFGSPLAIESVLSALFFSFFFFISGYIFFKKTEPYFADIV